MILNFNDLTSKNRCIHHQRLVFFISTYWKRFCRTSTSLSHNHSWLSHTLILWSISDLSISYNTSSLLLRILSLLGNLFFIYIPIVLRLLFWLFQNIKFWFNIKRPRRLLNSFRALINCTLYRTSVYNFWKIRCAFFLNVQIPS